MLLSIYLIYMLFERFRTIFPGAAGEKEDPAFALMFQFTLTI